MPIICDHTACLAPFRGIRNNYSTETSNIHVFRSNYLQSRSTPMQRTVPMGTLQSAHTEEYGRHLLLTRAVSAGIPVLKQQPYAAVLYYDEVPRHCDFCFAASGQLMRCSRSKFAHYCCVKHQRAAWKAYYRKESEALRACAPNVPPATVRLAARVLWRKASEETQQEPVLTVEQRLQVQQQSGGCYCDIEQLECHWDKLDASRKVMYAQMAVLTRQYMLGSTAQQPQSPDILVDGSSIPDVKHIAQLLARFACNNHTICDDELRPIGVGIYPLGALINHSCQPNCAQSFEGPDIVFRSLCALPAGQQVTISYIELAATRQERRRQLLQQYFFDVDAQQQQQTEEVSKADTGDSSSIAKRNLVEVTERAATAAVAPEAHENTPIATPTAQQDCLKVELKAPLLPINPHIGQHEQQQQQHVSQATASSVNSGSSSHSSAWLSSYPKQSKPPWPEDATDKHLCQMLLMVSSPSQLTGSRSSGGARSRAVKLPGGLCLLPQSSIGSRFPAGGTTADTADAAAAAHFFADLEALPVGDLHYVGTEAEQCAAGDVDGMQGVQATISQAAAAAAQPGQQTQQGPQRGVQQETVEVVQWGDWGAAAAAEGGFSTALSTNDLAVEAANLMLQLWSLQQQAEQLTRHGNAPAAVNMYQRALIMADGSCSPSDTTTSSISTSSTHSSSYRIALGGRHIQRIRLTAGLLKAAVDHGGMWEVALTAAKTLTPIYEAVYPKVWPNLGLHYALTAKLALYLQQPAVAAKAAAAAVDVLRVTHSSGSYVVQEVLRVQYEAQQELQAIEIH